jgi:recombination protein RecR
VVEDPSDILAIERSGSYRGRYHVLMGKVSPMHGESPEDLRLESLFKRIDDERYQEVVVALGMDVESDATASYINECLRNRGVRVTRLAVGIPAGSGIMYSDPVTLARAMKGRQSV